MLYHFIKAHTLHKILMRKRTVFLNATEDKTELAGLVSLAERLRQLPRATAPAPTKRRLYIAASLEAEAAGNRLLKWAGTLSGATLAVGLMLTAVLAVNSEPGSPLAHYKNQGQAIRLKLVTNQSDRANLQLQYAVTRLEETQSVLADSHTSAEQKVAALSELATQTQTTVENVKKVAIAQNDSKLLAKLEDITAQQTKVITTSTDPAVKTAADSALKATEEGSKTIAEAKRLVAAANEAAAVQLEPVTTTLSGTLVKISETEITVDKSAIVINEETEIIDSKGTAKPTLKVGQQITVVAVQNGDILVAQQVTIVTQPVVKRPEVTKPTKPEEPQGDISETIPDEVPSEPTPIQGGFLVEDPSPLYPAE
jgi:hypothetical protein